MVDSEREFYSPEDVVECFRSNVLQNGTPDLAGIEEEIGLVDSNGKPLSHNSFQAVLRDLIKALPGGEVIPGTSVCGDRIDVLQGSFLYGNVQPETNTTLVEYAHAPTDQSWGIFAQSKAFTQVLDEVAGSKGLQVIGCGVVPTLCWDDFLKNDVVIPNKSFIYSWTHMSQGTRPEYCRTVFGTASVHHNMGFNDPELMANYITTTLRMQPSMIALLGNSPLWDHQPHAVGGESLLSCRSFWQIDYGKIFCQKDGVSYLYPDFLIDPSADFSAIVNGYLDLPLDRTIIGGNKVFCNGLTMKKYLQGYEIAGKTYFPDEAALGMMVREPIVDVRPSFLGVGPRVEARAHDGVSQPVAVAIDAFYRGILENLDEAQDVTSGMTNQEIRHARLEVCKRGMAAPVRHENGCIKTQKDLMTIFLEIAKEGLSRRGFEEEVLLAPLSVLAETGMNPAERLLSVYKVGDTPQKLLDLMAYKKFSFSDGVGYPWPTEEPSTFQRSFGGLLSCSR